MSSHRDVDHALAYPEPPASPLWHRNGPKARPITPERQQRNCALLLRAQHPPAPLPAHRQAPGGGPTMMNPQTHLAISGYVDAMPAPGTSWGTACFDLIHSPADADQIAPNTPDVVYACTTGDPRIAEVLLGEIQPSDLLRVTGTVVQPETTPTARPGSPSMPWRSWRPHRPPCSTTCSSTGTARTP